MSAPSVVYRVCPNAEGRYPTDVPITGSLDALKQLERKLEMDLTSMSGSAKL